MLRAMGIVGFKDSGKTTLARELAAHFTAKGVKTAVIKHGCHGLDKADTDTEAFLSTGAAVAACCHEETGVFWPEARNPLSLLPLLDADILLVEGGKSLEWLPRILVLRKPDEAEELDRGLALASYGAVTADPLPVLSTVEQAARLVEERGFGLPGLDCGACGHDSCGGLARSIVLGEGTPDGCQATGGDVQVLVGGQPLAMNPFVERFFAAGIKAMLAELKGFAPGDITITLTDTANG